MSGRGVYSYAGNDPTDKTDPTGNIAGFDDVAEAGAVLLAAGALYVAAETCTPGSACQENANAGLDLIRDKVGEVRDAIVAKVVSAAEAIRNGVTPAKEHTKGKRPSTEGKHEEGQARKDRDRGGEKGDDRRDPRGKRPDGHKGPYPPPKTKDSGDSGKPPPPPPPDELPPQIVR